MKRSRSRPFVATSLVGSLAFGGSLAGYTPIACGCLNPWELLADRVDLPRDSWPTATAAKVQAGFERSYKNHKISSETLAPHGDCSMIGKREVRCTHWLWEKVNPETGIKDRKGYEITILVTKENVFESVRVDDIEDVPGR